MIIIIRPFVEYSIIILNMIVDEHFEVDKHLTLEVPGILSSHSVIHPLLIQPLTVARVGAGKECVEESTNI